ncbi:MAG TPA: hypothetical protein DD438_02350, partial [Verrucomicrobiales bacterium]|nr:hypothetical protein [Verrucomicrobiales bacterium]
MLCKETQSIHQVPLPVRPFVPTRKLLVNVLYSALLQGTMQLSVSAQEGIIKTAIKAGWGQFFPICNQGLQDLEIPLGTGTRKQRFFYN